MPDLQPGPTTGDLNHFRSITQLMREMDEIQHSASKKDADRDWFVRTAREADLDIDSNLEMSRYINYVKVSDILSLYTSLR